MPNRYSLNYTLVHGTVILTTLYLCYIANPGSNLFSWHPFLMTLSMVFLMNEAVLLYSPQWSLLPIKLSKPTLNEVHGYTQAAAFVVFNLGFAAIYINKEDNGKPHFKSWHGLLGLTQTVIIISQLSLGSLAKYAKLLPVKLDVGKLKTWHNLLGAIVIMFSILNMVTAFFTNFFASQTHILVAYFLCAVFVLLYGFVSVHVFTTNSRIASFLKKKPISKP